MSKDYKAWEVWTSKLNVSKPNENLFFIISNVDDNDPIWHLFYEEKKNM
jgi:hypothetical protein